MAEVAALQRLRHANLLRHAGIVAAAAHQVRRDAALLAELPEATLALQLADARLRNLMSWPGALASIASDVAAGLACLHAHGYAHGALCLSSVYLTNGWVAKLSATGGVEAAAAKEPAEPSIKHELARFAAPEIARGGDLKAKWAVGQARCAAVFTLSGRQRALTAS